jgi:hypothetical protein
VSDHAFSRYENEFPTLEDAIEYCKFQGIVYQQIKVAAIMYPTQDGATPQNKLMLITSNGRVSTKRILIHEEKYELCINIASIIVTIGTPRPISTCKDHTRAGIAMFVSPQASTIQAG